jgi:hypothetical protein
MKKPFQTAGYSPPGHDLRKSSAIRDGVIQFFVSHSMIIVHIFFDPHVKIRIALLV